MKLRKCYIVAVLIFIAMVFFRGNVAAYNMAEYFPLTQENSWTYSASEAITMGERSTKRSTVAQRVINGTKSFDGVETVKFEWRLPLLLRGGYDCLAMDSEGMKLHQLYSPQGTYSILDPPVVMHPAQFDLEEVYEGPWSGSDFSTKDDTLVMTFTGSHTVSLVSVEDVTVPAGTFEDCLKISDSITAQSGDNPPMETEHTFWYAHNVGVIKQDTTERLYDPEWGDIEVIMNYEIISATVDGVNYGCAATLALDGDARGNDLSTLRTFRDEVLSRTPQGQEIIRLYYEWSPVIVKAMVEDEEFKKEVKEIIKAILPMIRGVVE